MDDFNRNTQLLCTFYTGTDLKSIIYEVKDTYYLVDRKIFVFENEKDATQIILSYNVDRNYTKKLGNTISVHRKKQTNTLFSINSLNTLIKEENGGILDKKYVIDWNLYKNCLIISTEMGYKIINLNLKDVIRL